MVPEYPAPVKLWINLPLLLITRSDPGPAVAAVPSLVGRLVTNTKPACKTPRPVERPRGAVPWKNVVGVPLEGILIIVVPVPWRFCLLLKFETRMSPGCRGPDPA